MSLLEDTVLSGTERMLGLAAAHLNPKARSPVCDLRNYISVENREAGCEASSLAVAVAGGGCTLTRRLLWSLAPSAGLGPLPGSLPLCWLLKMPVCVTSYPTLISPITLT